MVLTLVEIDSNKQNKVNVGNRPTTASPFYDALKEGRAFTAATPSVPIHSEQFLNVRFENPSDSGVDCYFVSRKLQGNRPADLRPMQYGFVFAPVALTNAVSLSGANRLTGGSPSAMSVSYSVAPDRLDSDPSTASPSMGFLPNSGGILNVDDDNPDATRIVPPGYSFGFFMHGYAYQSGDAGRVVLTWYQEDAA